MKPLVVLTGPTGAGKSAIAAQVAARLSAEIVCADSRQIYRGFTIGSAQPDPADQLAVPHHLFAVLEPDQPCSAGAYRNMAGPVIDDIAARGKLPMLVGGTGLYVRAVLNELALAPPASGATLTKLNARRGKEGTEVLWHELASIDPEASQRIHRRDAYRIIRALAVHEDTGRRVTEWQAEHPPAYAPLVHIALHVSRPVLYTRINQRCERMFQTGILEEARALKAKGLPPALPALKAIGYQSLCAVLDGSITQPEALARMQRDTRRYAKRQLTWLRAQPGLIWIDTSDQDAAVIRVCEHASQVLQREASQL